MSILIRLYPEVQLLPEGDEWLVYIKSIPLTAYGPTPKAALDRCATITTRFVEEYLERHGVEGFKEFWLHKGVRCELEYKARSPFHFFNRHRRNRWAGGFEAYVPQPSHSYA